MIEETLAFLAKEMNDYFLSRYKEKDKVVLGSLVGLDGKPNAKLDNKVVMSLMNILEDKIIQSNSTTYARSNGRAIGRISPPVDLSLTILFAANFNAGNYTQALKYISRVIGFFQINRNFTRDSFPGMVAGVDRLNVEIVNMDSDSLHNVWGLIGGKYVPSIMYKLRSIRIQEAVIKEQVTPITGLRPEAEL